MCDPTVSNQFSEFLGSNQKKKTPKEDETSVEVSPAINNNQKWKNYSEKYICFANWENAVVKAIHSN